jgi:predicted MPP superfamily phosphohydrolase
MKGKQFMVFFGIVLLINLLVNYYIFSRTRAVFPAEKSLWWTATVFFWLLAFAYLIGRSLERSGAMWLAEPVIKIGAWWLGAMVYLTLLFLLTDLLRGLNGLFNFSELLKISWSKGEGKAAVALVYSLTAVILVAGYFSARIPVARLQAIEIEKPLPADLQKVVLVSDIHLGTMISNGRLQRMVELINKQNADLVLLAGDVFDEDLGAVIKNNMGDLLKRIEARHGVYAILGNHEFYGDADTAEKYLKDHHITVLRDSAAVLENGVVILGREDITYENMTGKNRKTISELLQETQPGPPVIVMDHQPYKLAEAAKNKVDLQVSGHTHNGQMWPFNYITGALFEISKGYGKIGNTHFYVSSGYGTWGPPIRTNSRSEIVVLEISGNE